MSRSLPPLPSSAVPRPLFGVADQARALRENREAADDPYAALLGEHIPADAKLAVVRYTEDVHGRKREIIHAAQKIEAHAGMTARIVYSTDSRVAEPVCDGVELVYVRNGHHYAGTAETPGVPYRARFASDAPVEATLYATSLLQKLHTAQADTPRTLSGRGKIPASDPDIEVVED